MHERDSARRLTVGLLHKRGRVVAVGASTAEGYGAASLRNFLLDEDFDRLAGVASAPGTGILGVLARLIPEKGVAELAVELRSVPRWTRLSVAGAPQDPAYARWVHDLIDDRSELIGHVDDVAGFLEDVDVLVVPSVGNEAQPTVILEALAAGRPVVVREGVKSHDYDGLPVFAYGDLSAALACAYAAPEPDRVHLRSHFGAQQALQAIEART
jgi:glycosyltransferase involved in cell wall biosynthesis